MTNEMADLMANARNSRRKTWEDRLERSRQSMRNEIAARGLVNSSIYIDRSREIDYDEAKTRVDELAEAAKARAKAKVAPSDFDNEIAAFSRHCSEETEQLLTTWMTLRTTRGMTPDASDAGHAAKQRAFMREYITLKADELRSSLSKATPRTPSNTGWTPGQSLRDGGRLLLSLSKDGMVTFEPSTSSDSDRRIFDRMVGELHDLANGGFIDGFHSQKNHESAVGKYNSAFVEGLTAEGWRLVEGLHGKRSIWSKVVVGAGVVLSIAAVITWNVTGDSVWEARSQFALIPLSLITFIEFLRGRRSG